MTTSFPVPDVVYDYVVARATEGALYGTYFAPAAPFGADPFADWLAFLAWRLAPERPVDRARRLRVQRTMRARARRAQRKGRVLR